MKCLRNLVGVSPIDKIRNEEVRRRAVIERELVSRTDKNVKVKSSMARSLPVANLLPQNVGSIINYLQ